MNPFANDGDKDDDILSEDDNEHVKDLMKSQLEISPLVPHVPPMPGDSTTGLDYLKRPYTGPPLSVSSSRDRGKSKQVALKKRKLNDESKVTEQDFRDIGSPTRPGRVAENDKTETGHPMVADATSSILSLYTAPTSGFASKSVDITVENTKKPSPTGIGAVAEGDAGAMLHQRKPPVIHGFSGDGPLAPLRPRPPPDETATEAHTAATSGPPAPKGLGTTAAATAASVAGAPVPTGAKVLTASAVPAAPPPARGAPALLPGFGQRHVAHLAPRPPFVPPAEPVPGMKAHPDAISGASGPLVSSGVAPVAVTQQPGSPTRQESASSVSTAPIAPESAQVATSPAGVKKDRRLDLLLAIVTGTRSPNKGKAEVEVNGPELPEKMMETKPSKVPIDENKTESESVENMAQDKTSDAGTMSPPKDGPTQVGTGNKKERKESLKKKVRNRGKTQAPPTRRILFARRESSRAKRILHAGTDLLHILPPNDCKFLAEGCWIFTKEQLLAVLDCKWPPGHGPESLDDVKNLRLALVTGLAMSSSFQKDLESKAKKFDSVSSSATQYPSHPSASTGPPATKEKEPPAKKEEAPRQLDPTNEGKAASTPRISPFPVPRHLTKVEDADKLGAEEARVTSVSQTESPPESGSAEKSTTVAAGPVQETDRGHVDTEMPDENHASSSPSKGSSERASAAVHNPFNMPNEFEPTPTKKASPREHTYPSPGPPVSPPKVELSKEAVSQAEAKLSEWRNLLEKKSGDGKLPFLEDSFPIDGPISFLVPQATRNFLATAKIKSLYEFFAVRKTETGAICHMMVAWRDECKLPKLPPSALARHLLGLSYRLETAVCSCLPVSPKYRGWMNDPMVIMTGAAREFLVGHMKLNSATDFLDSRTKALAFRLAAWRESKGLVPLKGSGKVAMVSGWKACAREEISVITGVGGVLKNIDLVAISSRDVPILKDESMAESPKRKAAKPVKQSPKPARDKILLMPVSSKHDSPKPVSSKHDSPKPVSSKPVSSKPILPKPIHSPGNLQVDYAKHSQLFVEHVLGKEIAALLSSAGIHTAAELDKAEASRDERLQEVLREANQADSWELVGQWCSKLKKQLEEMTTDSEEPKKLKPSRTSPPARVSGIADPFDILSTVTKTFLVSIGITTGEEFLSARTTDIANSFVKWRVQEGKPELKGLGAIASVSGWKATCRKAAAEMGLDDIAGMEPPSRAVYKPGTKKRKPLADLEQSQSRLDLFSNLPHAVDSLVTNNDVLSGNSKLIFSVQKAQGALRKFFFDISLRQTGDGAPEGLFLTYKGASPIGGGSTRSQESTILLETTPPSGGSVSLPVLVNVPVATRHTYSHFDERVPFDSKSSGFGLIELSAYGVTPLQRKELGHIKTAIRSFVFEKRDAALLDSSVVPRANIPESSGSPSANILVQGHGSAAPKFYFYMNNPIEKGQTCQLRFPEIESLLLPERYKESASRSRLVMEDALAVLCQEDLAMVLDWLKDDLMEGGKLNETNDESDGKQLSVCLQRRRVHWVSRRALALLKTDTGNGREIEQALYFGPFRPENHALGETESSELNLILKMQLREELLASLENDAVCGATMRRNWCEVARDLFVSLVDALVACYDLPAKDCANVFLRKVRAAFEPFSRLEDKKYELQQLQHGIQSQKAGSETNGIEIEGKAESRIVCEGMRPGKIVFKPLAEVANGGAEVSFNWYNEFLWKIASILLLSFERVLDERERKQFGIEEALQALQADLLSTTDTPRLNISSRHLSRARIRMPWELTLDQVTQQQVPKAAQFFLGIVWPALRKQGWRLEAGHTADEVVFSPPRTSQRKRRALMRQEGSRKRVRLAREIDKIGWGMVKKLSKQIVVAVSNHLDSEEGDQGHPADSASVSAKEAAEQLVEWVQDGLRSDRADGEILDRAGVIATAICGCFDRVAPYLSTGLGWGRISDSEVPSTAYKADEMFQFLLVLPSILRQSGLPLQEINDTLQVIQDVTVMFTTKYEVLFDKRVHPPVEKYVNEGRPASSKLAERLELLKPAPVKAEGDTLESKEGEAAELTEAILEEDKTQLTDFVVSVMEQFIPCRATEKDANKKYRRVHVGYAGLTCRHCRGVHGEGRYFFSSIESLTTASTVLEKHVYKCPLMPQEAKTRVGNARMQHAAQRKTHQNGSQQQYFNRLWDRLRSSKIGGLLDTGCEPLPSPGTKVYGEGKSRGSDSTEGEANEFRDHISVLNYVRTKVPWKTNRAIQVELDKYYSCLDYGGRIYQTPSMPEHFSSEWLLAKVCPKRYQYAKAKNLPG